MINKIIEQLFNETWGNIQWDNRKNHKTPEKTKDFIEDPDIKKEFIKAHPSLHKTDGDDDELRSKKINPNLKKIGG